MAYVEDITWSDKYIRLAPYTSNDAYVDLETGNNVVDFADGDFAKYGSLNFYLPNYSRGVIYLNDNLVEYDYGEYPDIENVKDGDVLKIYGEAKTPHTVTYDIAPEVSVEVRHDHIKTIDSPAVHSVLPGTQIHIAPKAIARAAASPIKVTVDNEAIEPDSEGIFSVIADGDKTIKIEKDASTGIVEINTGSAAKVYDLQGRRVTTPGRGIYIVNGKKVYINNSAF